mmetsp:Transcript_33483/g.53627  ORF Transcript_33483/g.53627 Transcript_33483/m.53627 type:complete len:348 (-) Transcript_33483:47-1090(-)
MGNQATTTPSIQKRKSITTVKDAAYLMSPDLHFYPDAWEYTIYGFIREFIENDLWSGWSKHRIIPDEIKKILTRYLKSELIVEEGMTHTLYSDIYWEYTYILLKKNSVLTVESWNQRKRKGGRLLLKIDRNLTMQEGARINVNQKGYKGGYFHEQGESFNGKGEENNSNANEGGGGGGKKRGAPAGYGARGVDVTDGSQTVHAGFSYGDEFLTVLYLGSGGGGGYSNGVVDNDCGGDGGGALDIQCMGEIRMEKSSVISANGGNSVYGGGGSGGSIKITCRSIVMSGQGDAKASIFALGGHDKDKYNSAGRGRIRISTEKNANNTSLNDRVLPQPLCDDDYQGAFEE